MVNKLSFKQGRELLEEGDVLLFRGQGIISFLIKKNSSGKYTHVGLASAHGSNGDKIWECVEFKEGKGGRTINLEKYVEKNSGTIDVFRAAPNKSIWRHEDGSLRCDSIAFNGKGITNIMRKMTGLPYGWRRVAWLIQFKIPVLKYFYSIESFVDDSTKDLVYPVCSTAVAYSFAKTGYDLVHHRADKATEPSDLARSPLLSYLFTLTKN